MEIQQEIADGPTQLASSDCDDSALATSRIRNHCRNQWRPRPFSACSARGRVDMLWGYDQLVFCEFVFVVDGWLAAGHLRQRNGK
jgi:hypothetical protein